MDSPLQELQKARKELFNSLRKGKATESFQADYAEIVDQYLRRALQESSVGQKLFHRGIPFAFVAVGGYGRKELCAASDIDVMVLFKRSIPTEAKALMREVLWPLWDAGLDVGYGTRTIKDCVSLSKNDFAVLTSLLDARLVCGDSPLYLELLAQVRSKALGKRKRASFRKWIQEIVPLRMKLYGDASYLLEPNLKEGIGGLRDYHSILWASKVYLGLVEPRDLEYHGLLSHREFTELQKSLAMIWRVRNHLHLMSGRKNDRLIIEYQEQIARNLGYRNADGLKAVEVFLGELHASMAGIKSISSSFFTTHLKETRSKKRREKLAEGIVVINNELNFVSPEYIISNPTVLIEIFRMCASRRLTLSAEARRLVQEFIYLVDERYCKSVECAQSFLSILKAQGAYEALEAMQVTGMLGAYIPEFKKVQDRVQFDTYHIYPVGRHLLETVKRLKELRKQGEIILATVLSEIKDTEALFLAALLHDIGKTGKGHSRRGAALAKTILSRLGLEEATIDLVAFLVEHHLLLVETASRRDLDDEKVIVQCARAVGSIERLKMLYLLTWADSAATGPRAWSDWMASLVQELFFKVLHILAKKELATEDAAARLRRMKIAVSKRLGQQVQKEELHGIFQAMSTRYLLSTPPAKVFEHIMMAREIKGKTGTGQQVPFILAASLLEAQKCWELTFVGRDRPGLFSEIAGVLAFNNVNILSARVHTWSDGTVVDIFQVTPPLDPLRPYKTWEKVSKELRDVFRGRASLPDMLASKAKGRLAPKVPVSTRQPKVAIDNEASDFFTVIEVFADDRIGILYLITRTLFELGLDIRVAKIATKVDQIADAFYVRDQVGQKITESQQLEKIERALMERLK